VFVKQNSGSVLDSNLWSVLATMRQKENRDSLLLFVKMETSHSVFVS
jgi:hypothetical protein